MIEQIRVELSEEQGAHEETRQKLLTLTAEVGELRGKLSTLDQGRRLLLYVIAGIAVVAAVLLVVVLLLALTPGG